MQEGCPGNAVVRATPIQRDGRGLRIGLQGDTQTRCERVDPGPGTQGVLEWPRGLVEDGRPGGCERPGNEAAERVTGGDASDPTARYMKGRHAGQCKAFGNHVRHVGSGQTIIARLAAGGPQ